MKSYLSISFFMVLMVLSFSSFANNKNEQTVVLISIDGFRWDYIEKHNARNIARIANTGVRATHMRPVYPTKTFPNHLSIITGLLPSNHGIIGNYFCNKRRDECYKMGQGLQDSTWLNGIPLWNLAELQGVKAATYFWPESDARFNGRTPTYFMHYSKHGSYQKRVDQMVNWLQLPKSQRPRFVAGYFSLVDDMGHDFGPDAKQTYDAVQEVDKLIGQLWTRLQSEVDHDVNFVLVSDHGMASVDPTKTIILSELSFNLDDFKVKNGGSRTHLYKKQSANVNIEKLKSHLSKVSLGRFEVLSHEVLRKRGVTIDETTADIIIETKPPYAFGTYKRVSYRGTHGYSYSKDMAAIFVANGPAFKSGVTLPEVNNLDIYPMVADVLGLELLSKVDGDGQTLMPALSE
ncbi:ectonucleotide pyrophosphatase/phosphodiesterase [Pseudoalteromonas luteoviolacea]|uniref:alkaline phosphatase family protein n=1 Tax=Pseudoalteromonas luteoviolacea TaxID=43657 RepID=UPI00115155AB|nr:ectonucleotide pyrophosphatase/phosphodiesterase [Pseudoalteromonas luteoviolacea]TQF67692.1 alkaline phosphatase family protein [Pseudoalteromonas luteoviolacea]